VRRLGGWYADQCRAKWPWATQTHRKRQPGREHPRHEACSDTLLPVVSFSLAGRAGLRTHKGAFRDSAAPHLTVALHALLGCLAGCDLSLPSLSYVSRWGGWVGENEIDTELEQKCQACLTRMRTTAPPPLYPPFFLPAWPLAWAPRRPQACVRSPGRRQHNGIRHRPAVQSAHQVGWQRRAGGQRGHLQPGRYRWSECADVRGAWQRLHCDGSAAQCDANCDTFPSAVHGSSASELRRLEAASACRRSPEGSTCTWGRVHQRASAATRISAHGRMSLLLPAAVFLPCCCALQVYEEVALRVAPRTGHRK